ncbi:MAG: GNAT family N-acetyltransferase [Egibacteraceae bacterium]
MISAPVTRDGLRLRLASSIAEVDRADWAPLVREAPVFYGYEFLRSIERNPLSAGSTARYLLAHDGGGTLIAGVPLYVARTRDPFASEDDSPAVRILASHLWHCYDTVLPSRVPVDAALAGVFWDGLMWLRDEVDAEVCGLVNVDLEGRLAAALAAIGVPVRETAPRYRLPLSGGPSTMDEHLAGIGRASRRSLRQYRRRALAAGAVITCAEPDRALDDDVLALCLATANKHAPGYYPPDELAALLRALGPDCRILRVELDGVLLATSICLLDATRAHFWAGGCRYPDELNWSPQYVLFAAELEVGLASGKPVLEFGRRNDEFKRRYGLCPRRLGRAMVVTA